MRVSLFSAIQVQIAISPLNLENLYEVSSIQTVGEAEVDGGVDSDTVGSGDTEGAEEISPTHLSHASGQASPTSVPS